MMKKRVLALFLCAVMTIGLCACGNTQGQTGTSGGGDTDEPVVIENMGITTTYEKAPESAVALSYSIAEIMVALGLKDKLVAVAPSMYILDQVSEEYRADVGSLPLLE